MWIYLVASHVTLAFGKLNQHGFYSTFSCILCCVSPYNKCYTTSCWPRCLFVCHGILNGEGPAIPTHSLKRFHCLGTRRWSHHNVRANFTGRQQAWKSTGQAGADCSIDTEVISQHACFEYMSMKIMWIIVYCCSSHQISTQLDTYGRLWAIKTPNEGLSFGRMVFIPLVEFRDLLHISLHGLICWIVDVVIAASCSSAFFRLERASFTIGVICFCMLASCCAAFVFVNLSLHQL